MGKKTIKETVVADASGAFDVPFLGTTPKGRNNPLKIDGIKSVKKSRAVTDKNFPKWGGPGGKYIKIKEECKKFPYCNQGEENFELLESEHLDEVIEEISKEKNIPKKLIENIIKGL